MSISDPLLPFFKFIFLPLLCKLWSHTAKASVAGHSRSHQTLSFFTSNSHATRRLYWKTYIQFHLLSILVHHHFLNHLSFRLYCNPLLFHLILYTPATVFRQVLLSLPQVFIHLLAELPLDSVTRTKSISTCYVRPPQFPSFHLEVVVNPV